MLVTQKKYQDMQASMQLEIDKLSNRLAEIMSAKSELQKDFAALQDRYDEVSKRKENLVELLLAFRDMEVDTGVIKITRINPDDIFLRGRR